MLNRNQTKPGTWATIGCAGIGLSLALVGWGVPSWRAWAWTLGLFASGMFVAALAAPSHYRSVDRWIRRIAYLVATLVSWLLLVSVYLIVLTPYGLTLKLLGHDPLGQRRQSNPETHWHLRPGSRPPEDYFRQY